jgi:cytochrome d ubiquinol oxidase subunit II
VGFFTVFLCRFLAAIYLAGAVNEPGAKSRYIRKAKFMNTAMFLCVLLIFLSAYQEEIPLVKWISGNLMSSIATCLTSISFCGLWFQTYRQKYFKARFFAGFMVTALLIAATYSHFPDIILLKKGTSLSLTSQSAPTKTISVLGSALLIGSLFILPSFDLPGLQFRKKG